MPTTMHRLLPLALLAAAAAFLGCGRPAHVTGAAAVGVTAANSFTTRFPGAASVLEGFEIAGSTGEWRVGDRVLLGLSFVRGTSRTERMLLVELLDGPGERERFRRKVGVFGDEVEIDSPTRATRLRVYDEEGRLLSDREGQLAEIFLDYGPWEVARIGGGYAIATGAADKPPQNPRPEIGLETLRPGVYGMMSMLAFGEGAGENRTLSSLIEKAFTTGQKMGLLLSLGRFEIRIGAAEPEPAGVRRDGLAAPDPYDAEIRISVNGKLALEGRAVLSPALAPLGMCGGIVMADLVNEADADIRAGIVLLAARRGEPTPNGASTDAKAGG